MEAKRDQNHVPTILGTLDSDGMTPVVLYADPTTHRLKVDDDTTGIDLGGEIANRDENHVTTLIAVQSDDEETPITVYGNVDNKLLIDSS